MIEDVRMESTGASSGLIAAVHAAPVADGEVVLAALPPPSLPSAAPNRPLRPLRPLRPARRLSRLRRSRRWPLRPTSPCHRWRGRVARLGMHGRCWLDDGSAHLIQPLIGNGQIFAREGRLDVRGMLAHDDVRYCCRVFSYLLTVAKTGVVGLVEVDLDQLGVLGLLGLVALLHRVAPCVASRGAAQPFLDDGVVRLALA